MGYKDQVRGGLDTSPGFFIRADGMPHRTTTPSWEHETRIRIFPAPAPDGGFESMRVSADEFDFGSAVWSEPVARCLGVKESFTYITRIPNSQNDPTKTFVKAITALIDEKPRDVPESWLKWVKRGRKNPPKIDKVKSAIFFQGMLIMSQGKMLVNHMKQPQPQFPILLMGGVSLQMAFERHAHAAVVDANGNPNYSGPPLSSVTGTDEQARQARDAIYAGMFQIGDWCSIEHGRIMSIFQAPPSDNERPHYELNMLEELPLEQIADQVRAHWRPWDQLLKYHTAEEQIQLLCRAFPYEAVDFALTPSEYRDLIPADAKGAWKRYRDSQVVSAPGMQGMGMPQQQPMQMQMPTGAPAPTLPSQQPPVQQTQTPVQQAPQQFQQQPVQQTQTPVQQPQQPAAPVANGYNLSGAPVTEPTQAPGSIMDSGAFGQQPPEFQAPAQVPPQQPQQAVQQQPAQQVPGTPPAAVSGDAVSTDKLGSALEDLRRSRGQASEGNLGQ